jgi:RNA polymerase sigma-70 factor (ECF subfamily)
MANTYENCRKEAARMVTGIDCSAEGAFPHCCTYIDCPYEYRNIIEQIRYLPPMYRTPFMLYVDGYKYEEIAEKLGIPVGTVKSRIFTARERLKAMLGDIY